MIKDKITPKLKTRFLEEIDKTMKNGNERGFLLCRDIDGTLSASRTSIGENDKINFSDINTQCPFMIQGDFHTHASASDMKRFIKKELPEEKVSDDVVRDIAIKLYKKNGISTTEPSHGDLLGLLVLKGKNKIIGTVCTGSDAEPNKIECWTARDNINNDDYKRASVEIKNPNLSRHAPHDWIKPLFHKEIINLK